MRYDYHEIGELEAKGRRSFAGPRHLQGSGKRVRTYTQSQFVGCLLSLLDAATAAADELDAVKRGNAKLRKELAATAKFLKQQGIDVAEYERFCARSFGTDDRPICGGFSKRNNDADGNLIAAAPALLEACKVALRLCGDVSATANEALRDAIAKAEEPCKT